MPSGHDSERYEPRYPANVVARLIRGKQAFEVVTEDVSFRGLFLRADAPPPVRQLVRLEMRLPPAEEKITLHGMVTFVTPPGAQRAPGFGVKLVGLDGAVKHAWHAFVQHVQEALAPRGPRLRFERAPHALELHARRASDLRLLESTDARGVFVATDLPLPTAVQQSVLAVHPETGATIVVDATVLRRARDGDRVGVEVAFSFDEQARAVFASFAASEEQAILEEDLIEVDLED